MHDNEFRLTQQHRGGENFSSALGEVAVFSQTILAMSDLTDC